ncbi:carbon-nitrogen hydrolase family protein [Isachenkonia alkalipeptolytica]|uniref:Carbon-nitrogen hydrolase family protein n=1 Tax=Isachenkonia alkalipeptolytica TaxID=2565777 RepID=A0AA43XIF5_9CLOT|nr:carbon-nitrogen hydrolase family protein [Isachenkonia alkalipeptolytica]NBG87031.1 carbon-nitrogen hydrolase family protein [Isachenkonia alkalipeptolytica]
MKTVKVLGCQMMVEEDKKMNLEKAEEMIARGIRKYQPDIIILPEMFNTPYDNSYFPEFSEAYGGDTTLKIQKLAKEQGVMIIAGSIPEQGEGEKEIYNTTYVFGSKGELLGKHRKIHLFDIDIPGKITFKESDVLSPGEEITVLDTKFGKIGIAICYDVRFPELFQIMEKEGARLVVIPGAFNTTTGPAHWELLMRSRALDNQVYVAAVSPARNSKASYQAYGHSMIVDPWGRILDELEEKEGFLYRELDIDYLHQVRGELPTRKNRRVSLYDTIKK